MAKKTQTLDDLAASAEAEIQKHARLYIELITATDDLAACEGERARRKLAAIARVCQQEHPATPGKPFSASAADGFAQVDPEYKGYKERCAALSLIRLQTEKALENQKLIAELRIALVRAHVGAGA
jgi:hypothetical protein